MGVKPATTLLIVRRERTNCFCYNFVEFIASKMATDILSAILSSDAN